MTKQQANFLLVLVTVGWGASYILTKFNLQELTPIFLVGLRFIIAFLITAMLFFRKIMTVTKGALAASLILGTLLSSISILFSFALKFTNASTAGFIFATTVIFVPVIMTCITRKLPTLQVTIGASVTLIGLAVFTLKSSLSFDLGMLLCLLAALLYAVHIVLNNYFVRRYDGFHLGIYQLLFGGALALTVGGFIEGVSLPVTTFGWTTLLLLAIVCSAFAVIVQSIAQKYTTAVHTGFIFSLEPIFAAILAFIFLGEWLSGREVLGAMIIFLGVLLANSPPYYKKKKVVQAAALT